MHRILVLVIMALMAGVSPDNHQTIKLKVGIPLKDQMQKENVAYLVSHDFDLAGDTLRIPDKSELVFQGGKFSNGIISGSNTAVNWTKGSIFDGITVIGTWNVPIISTAMFSDLSAVNAVRNVFALSDDNVQNMISIEDGHYPVKVKLKDLSGVSIKSNSVVSLNGVIEMVPNNMKTSYVVSVIGKRNVVLQGGEIVGEKDSHLGDQGEWGMGIFVKNSDSVTVRNMYVHNCWGDCIQLQDGSSNCIVDNCRFENARRQGVTVGGVLNAMVSNCTISHIEGTAPEAGIDIEPNANHSAKNITIDNVTIKDCIGGIFTYGNAENVVIDNILIKNCTIGPLLQPKTAVSFSKTSNLRMEGCTVNNPGALSLRVVDCSGITVTGNTFKSPNSQRAIFCNKVKGLSVKGNSILGAVQGNYKSGEVSGNKKITK